MLANINASFSGLGVRVMPLRFLYILLHLLDGRPRVSWDLCADIPALIWQQHQNPAIISNKLLVNYMYVLASGNFCHLLITFAISLDPDQDLQPVGLDLDPNHLTL